MYDLEKVIFFCAKVEKEVALLLWVEVWLLYLKWIKEE